MSYLRIIIPCLIVSLIATSGPVPSSAEVRRVRRPLLRDRAAISGYIGLGFPVGEFGSGRLPEDGNHESGALDWAFEGEYFFARTASLGFSVANTTYEDKDFPDLETHLSTYSVFFRAVIPTNSMVRPYVRAGLGSVDVQFQDDTTRVNSENSLSFQFGGGLLWLPDRRIGLNTQVLYYAAGTDDAYIPEADAEVGFDTKYFVFSGGISIFFP